METETSTDGYHKLAAAIVIQAVDDFRKAIKHLVRGRGNLDLDLKEIDDVIRFVNSKWFTTLTDIEQSIVINKLKEEVAQSGIDKILGPRKYQEFFEKTFQDN